MVHCLEDDYLKKICSMYARADTTMVTNGVSETSDISKNQFDKMEFKQLTEDYTCTRPGEGWGVSSKLKGIYLRGVFWSILIC